MNSSLSKVFFSKRMLASLLIFLALIVFRSFFKEKFDAWLVLPLLSKVKSTQLNDFVFLTAIIGLIVWLYNGFKRKILFNGEWMIACLYLLLGYIYSRLNGNYYEFAFMYLRPEVAYADLIHGSIFLFFLVCCYQCASESHAPNYRDRPFLVDIPIKNGSQDLLNRMKFAVRIADKIQSKPKIKNSGALAIGITGEWGSGKTSFSNMVEDALEIENRIILHFNPWRSASAKKIIEDFFELLIAELGKYDSQLSGNIYSYAKTLTKIDENLLTKGIQTITELFENASKNEVYDSINESIENTKKQIIIFIDDLDRLDRKEITEVLRIIRNTANFNNLVYVVSYDQNYVLEAVKSFNPTNYTSFLEKIFQFEFTLPMYEAGIIRTYLTRILADALPNYLHNEITGVIESRAQKGINFTNELIQTHRAAIRLANAIIFELEGLEREVLFYDFYLLQLFKLKYPIVFRNLFEHDTIFFITDVRNKDKYYRLRENHERSVDVERLDFMRMMDLTGDGNNRTDLEKEPIFYVWLDKILQGNEISDYDVHLIKGIINELLNVDRNLGDEFLNKKSLAFARVNNFFKYFAFELMAGEVSSQEFEESRNSSWADYLEKIHEWSEKEKSTSYLDKLFKIESFSTTLEYENHVRALFEIGRAYADGPNIYGFDLHYLLNILEYPFKKSSKSNLYADKSDFEKFFRNVISTAPMPRKFENYVFYMLMEQKHDFVIDNNELSKLSFKNFKDYIESIDSLNSNLWSLFHNTRIWMEDYHQTQKNPEAKNLIAAFWKDHTSACDLGNLIMQVDPGSEYYFLDGDRWGFYFDSLNELDYWLLNAENIDRDSLCFKEFNGFYELNRANSFRGSKFEFEHIIPNRWQ